MGEGRTFRVFARGQAGSNQAGWRAAACFSLPTGARIARRSEAEAGPRPQFGPETDSVESARGERARTEVDARKSNATADSTTRAVPLLMRGD